MKRSAITPLALLLTTALLAGSCAPGDTTPSTTTTVSGTTLAVSATSSSNAQAGTTTTPSLASTTTRDTTTTTLAAVPTTDPNLPSAMGREQIPWSEVGAGWYVVLYDPSRAFPADASDVREGPVVLYLVDKNGNRYEITAWAPGEGPYMLVDATTSSALIVGSGATADDTVYERIDLATGSSTIVHNRGYPESTYGSNSTVSLTRPSGANVVVYRSDGSSEWLERRSPDGSVITTVFTQAYADASSSLDWMYGYEGTSLLVTHHGGIAHVSNAGVLLDDVWVPMDTRCEPQRWWDADTFVAACYGQGPATAPDDGYGNPHTYYGQVWLLNTDGTAGVALTTMPATADVVDFGYLDAWPLGADTLLRWTGDCGSAGASMLQPDGTAIPLPVTAPPSLWLHAAGMIDVLNGRIAHYGWETCDAWVGELFSTDTSGSDPRVLVPKIGDGRSVIGVVGLTTVYP